MNRKKRQKSFSPNPRFSKFKRSIFNFFFSSFQITVINKTIQKRMVYFVRNAHTIWQDTPPYPRGYPHLPLDTLAHPIGYPPIPSNRVNRNHSILTSRTLFHKIKYPRFMTHPFFRKNSRGEAARKFEAFFYFWWKISKVCIPKKKWVNNTLSLIHI